MSFDEAWSGGELLAAGGAVGGRRGLDWREADRQLRRIAKRRAGLDAEEARWLLAAQRAEVHARLGCASFAEYVERVLGYGPRVCADRLRVAEALEELPATADALAGGAICYSAVRELTRVTTPATEDTWLERAHGKTAREVEQLVTGHQRGDLPDDPIDPDLAPCTLRFEVLPETYALFRDAQHRIMVELGHMPTDDEVIDAMSRAVLAPTGVDANSPPYQIALTVCAQCERATQDGGGRAIDVGPEVVALARCDAQTIGLVDGNTRTRASRTIPPALRRQVLRRDHGRCIVPGCRATRWIQVHHLEERGKGGANEAFNTTCLCSGHHRALHLGHLSITGEPGHRLFWNSDGAPWGTAPRSPTWAATASRAPTGAQNATPTPTIDKPALRGALCKLGFKPAEATAAIDHALARVGATAPLEDILRAALAATRQPM